MAMMGFHESEERADGIRFRAEQEGISIAEFLKRAVAVRVETDSSDLLILDLAAQIEGTRIERYIAKLLAKAAENIRERVSVDEVPER